MKALKIGSIILIFLFTTTNIFASEGDDLWAMLEAIMSEENFWEDNWWDVSSVEDPIIVDENIWNQSWEAQITWWQVQDWGTIFYADEVDREEVELNSAYEVNTTESTEVSVLPKTWPTEMLLLFLSLFITWIIFYKRRKTV